MLSDADLAEYLDGAMGKEAMKCLEELAVEKDAVMGEIVAQLRIHRILQLHANGVRDEAILKESILDAALGRGLRYASAGTGRRTREVESEPGLELAVVGLVLVILLAAFLWYNAP